MMERTVALNAVAIAAVALALVSCNFMMPTANYPVMRQEKGFHLIRSASMTDVWFRGDIKIVAAVLDGASSRDAVYDNLGAYFVVEAKDRTFDGFLHIDQAGLRFINRNGLDYEGLSMAQGPQPGFWARRGGTNEIVQIIDDGTGSAAQPAVIANLGTTLVGPVPALWMDWDWPPGSTPPDTYRAVFVDNVALSFRSDTVPLAGAAPADFTAPLARDIMSNSFEELNSSGDPYWNDGRFEFKRFGFSSTAGYSWFAIRRFDGVSGREEVRAVVISDVDPYPTRTVRGEPQGNADGVLVIRQESKAPAIRYSLTNGRLQEHRKITIYGDDAFYLGDALELIGGVPTPVAVFGSITAGPETKDGGRRVTVSLWAHRLATLAEGE